jgi:hypothetical protein
MPNQGYSYYCTQRELVTDGKQRPPAGMGPRRRWTAAVRSAINRRRPAVRLPRCWLTFWRASHRHRVARSGRRATIIRWFCSARRPSSERGRPPPPGSPPSAAHYTCRAPRLLPAPHRATQSFTHRGRSAGRAAVPAGPQRPVRVRCRLLHGWQPRTEARSWHRLREAGRVLSPA